MNRRDFLQKAGLGALALPHFAPHYGKGLLGSTSPLVRALRLATAPTDHVLVLVRLDGGNDGLNTVVPIDQYDNLANARSAVILPQSSLLPLSGNSTLRLHPAMTGLRNLYDAGKLKIIQSVGYPEQSFSHFRSSDIWMSGADADEIMPSGWAGRYLQHEFPNFPNGFPNAAMPDPLAIEMGSNLSLTLQSLNGSMGLSIYNPAEFYQLVSGVTSPAPDTLAGAMLEHVRLVKSQSNAYGQVVTAAYNNGNNAATYPGNNELAEQLAIVARLMAGGLQTRIYQVTLSGFDTHDQQVDWANHTQGEHAMLLGKLSSAISVFMQDIQQLGLAQRVVGLTYSEFGRRIIANGSTGTDHGAAAPMFVFGHAVEGGVLGQNPIIPANAQWYDNVPMQYDFRSVYASVLGDWFCLPDGEAEAVLAKDLPKLPIFSPSACSTVPVRAPYQQAGQRLAEAWPNPFREVLEVELLLEGQCVLQLFRGDGTLVETLHSQRQARKGQRLSFTHLGHLPAGHYYLRVQGAQQQHSLSLVKY